MMENEVMSEVSASPRRVVLISAGASHTVALLSKHQSHQCSTSLLFWVTITHCYYLSY